MSDPETTGGKQSGGWKPGQSGNPAGRPKGARHAALLALDAIGAGAAGEIMDAVVTAAKAGDMRAADILLRRLWPERKGRPVDIRLPPMKRPEDIATVLATVTAAMAAGDLSPEEAQQAAAVLETQRRAIETSDLERRLAALEQAQQHRLTK
jgi:hypothetical protein